MDSTYYLEITVPSYAHRIPFEGKQDADDALKILEDKMGLGKYRNDPENNRHRIASPSGDIVLTMDNVIAARVVDEAEYQRLTVFANAAQVKLAAEVNATLAAALVEVFAVRDAAKQSST